MKRRKLEDLYLVRHGRLLTPASRLKYRIRLFRTGRVEDGGSLLLFGLRLLLLPVGTLLDYVTWPVLSVILRSQPWWVVTVDWHDDGVRDIEFVRVRQVATKAEAESLARQLSM